MPKPLTSVHHLLAAFEAGIIMVFLTNPLWLIKTRMQLQPGAAAQLKQPLAHEAYTGVWHAVRTIVREEGPRGLYKGRCVDGRTDVSIRSLAHSVVATRPVSDMTYTAHTTTPPAGLLPALLLTSHGALQFVTYEWLKRVAEPYHVPVLSYSVLGGLAKIVAGLATYPYQVNGWMTWNLCRLLSLVSQLA